MKTSALIALIALAALTNVSAQEPEDVEVRVNVLGEGGVGKFSEANITVESNKVLQAAFAGAPGNTLDAMVAAQDSTVYVAGSSPGPTRLPGDEAGGAAFVARISPDMRHLERMLRLPPVFVSANCLAVSPDGAVVVAGEKKGGGLMVARLTSDLGRILWSRSVMGDRAASVCVAPDGSVVVSPVEKPFVSRIAADGSRLIPFGNKETFRTDGANPDIHKAWWEGCGYAASGYKGSATYHRGGNAGVVALKDGTFVLFTTNFLTHPGGGPDFDPMLLKFDANGNILWCTNLLDGLPAESDHKQPRMAVDPYTGDLLLAAVQHGHFTHNFIATPGAYLNPHAWFTGNIMIGWIARVDPATGQPKAATFLFPEMPGPMVAGKRRANSLFPQAPAADAEGNLYITGSTAWKFETTLHAFQSEPLGGCGFVAVFNPDLSRLTYASLITSKGYDFSGRAIVTTPGGPAVIGNYQQGKTGPFDFVTANHDATNYLLPRPPGPRGGFVGYYPSAPWKD